MERGIIKKISTWATLVVCLSWSANLSASEEFQGRLLMGSGLDTKKVMKLRISIDSYTSSEEAFQLMETLYSKGYQPFMSVFRGINKGVIKPVGGRGVNVTIHAAQAFPTEKGRKILLFTERQSWDLQVQ